MRRVAMPMPQGAASASSCRRDKPNETSGMVMQSEWKQVRSRGSPGSPSGAVYVNDKRGTGKDANGAWRQINVNKPFCGASRRSSRLAAAERSGELLSRPQAVGKVVPVYVATKTICAGHGR